MKPTRVLLADDQADVRAGFRLILEAQPDIQVVADAADGRSAVESARRLRPDVVVTDIRMPRLDGLEVTRALAGPGTPDPMRVIVVTTFDLDEYVHAALMNGACGFLLKRGGAGLLVEAVRAAVAGDTLVSPAVTVRLLQAMRRQRPDARTVYTAGLTERETAVVRLLARGLTNADIAGQLFVSIGTVKTHVAAVARKLGAPNRVAIAAWAWEHGLVETEA